MQSKRGVQIQFNWIFVLIAGFIILILVTSIVVRQKSISDTSKNVVILNNLDAILAGSEVSTGTSQLIAIPFSEITFACNRYSIGSVSKQLNTMNVFVPATLGDDQLIALSLDWNMPYRILNIVYLTTPNYRYILVGDIPQREELFRLIPNETFIDFFPTLAEATYRGEEKVRFVLFGSAIEGTFVPPSFRSVPDDDMSGLQVNPNGIVTFYEVRDDRFTNPRVFSSLNIESTIGAIITDDPNIYQCVMDYTFERMLIITEIYQKKVQSIRDHYFVSSKNNHCDTLQTSAYSLEPYTVISFATSKVADTTSIRNAAETIKQNNKQAQLQSCATIY